jgi:hypothetical protein
MKFSMKKLSVALVGAVAALASVPSVASAGQVYSDRIYREIQTYDNNWHEVVTVQPAAATTSTGSVQVVTRVWYYGTHPTNYYRVRLAPFTSPGTYQYGPSHTLNTTVDYWYNDTIASWKNQTLYVTLEAYTANQSVWDTPYNTLKNSAFDIYYN